MASNSPSAPPLVPSISQALETLASALSTTFNPSQSQAGSSRSQESTNISLTQLPIIIIIMYGNIIEPFLWNYALQ